MDIKDRKTPYGHEETILCPECGSKEKAFVSYTNIFNVYIHECKNCDYTIMESEWDKIE